MPSCGAVRASLAHPLFLTPRTPPPFAQEIQRLVLSGEGSRSAQVASRSFSRMGHVTADSILALLRTQDAAYSAHKAAMDWYLYLIAMLSSATVVCTILGLTAKGK